MVRKLTSIILAGGILLSFAGFSSVAASDVTPQNANCKHHGGCIPYIDFL